jgi:DNA invertase Pin-like site-specific DNA recombinase
MKKQKVNILYERLSKDDELQGPSNSILNQQQLLEEYAERNGLIPYVHIQDDGYSGTHWNRPGWQKLIEMVEADEVNCICIKDGTRLGRNYLRAGLYREIFTVRQFQRFLAHWNTVVTWSTSAQRRSISKAAGRK